MNAPLFGQPGTLALCFAAYLAFAAGSAFGVVLRSRRPRYVFDNAGAWA